MWASKITIEKVEPAAIDRLSTFESTFQSPFWAKVKEFVGWTHLFFSLKEGEDERLLLVLVKKLPFNVFIAYVPYGPPLFFEEDFLNEYLDFVSTEIRKYLPKTTLFIRYDLPWGSFDKNLNESDTLNFCSHSIQPEATIVLNLSKGYEKVRSSYKKRNLRHIQKCEKEQLFVKEWDKEENSFSSWYSIYLENGRMGNFSCRSAAYLKNMFSVSDDNNKAKLFLAYLGEEIVGGIVVIFNLSEATYLFGATVKELNISVAYALQDYVIRVLCQDNVAQYNLMGIAGPKDHFASLKGVTFFKESFGGIALYRKPTVDYKYRKMLYCCFVLIEKLKNCFH
ncbi:MAG: peptidoglycan bridge formation glycyltransferase FemA/FemB family protein [Sphaerochaetaceae bacterium]